MSAQIPDTMLLSDLLKATGYDCPSELQEKTFAAATVDETEVQTKEVTIVSNTETEVTPDTGKLLSKVTVTTAVPNKLYAYREQYNVVYLKAIPSEDTAEVAVYVPEATGFSGYLTGSYTKETDTITISTSEYARYAGGDFQI